MGRLKSWLLEGFQMVMPPAPISQHPRDVLLQRGVDPARHKGIEFGALNNPIVRKEQGDIRFVDYTTTEGLRSHPHASTVIKESIVDVDYVWRGTGRLADVVGETACFDYAIASHVIEHVPNVLGWFEGITEVLRPGGVFNLAIPDRRYTFDMGRNDSTLGELVEAYLLKYSRPSVRQEFDHCNSALDVEPGAVWNGGGIQGAPQKYLGDSALRLAYDQAVDIIKNNSYYDSHCWVFTPNSFVDLLYGATELGLFPLVLENLTPTAIGEFEFFANFRRPDDRLSPEHRRDLQIEGLTKAKAVVLQQLHQARLLASD